MDQCHNLEFKTKLLNFGITKCLLQTLLGWFVAWLVNKIQGSCIIQEGWSPYPGVHILNYWLLYCIRH